MSGKPNATAPHSVSPEASHDDRVTRSAGQADFRPYGPQGHMKQDGAAPHIPVEAMATGLEPEIEILSPEPAGVEPLDIDWAAAAAAANVKAGSADHSFQEAAAPRIDPRDAELAQMKDQLLRTAAEMENLRRRTAREIDENKKYAAGALAKDFLSVADNLRRAMESVPQDLLASDGGKALVAGLELVERELLSAFEKHRILPIEPLGQRFDPKVHEAMFEMESPDHQPGTVTFVHEKGYVIADRLLRPAKVGVARAPAGHPNPGSVNRTA